MKRFLGVFALLLCGCGFVQGDGNVTSKPLTLDAFDVVENTTQLVVTLAPPPGTDALTIDENLREFVRIEVSSTGVLRIETTRWIVPTATPEVVLHAAALERIFSSGSGPVTASDFGPIAAMELESTGSGAVRYEGLPEVLKVRSTGSGSVTAMATGDVDADLVEVTSSGSGAVHVESLPGVDLTVTSSGSGAVEGTVHGGVLRIKLTGSGSVTWHGTAATNDVDDTGSGDVIHE